jgi:hypothetical protein
MTVDEPDGIFDNVEVDTVAEVMILMVIQVKNLLL